MNVQCCSNFFYVMKITLSDYINLHTTLSLYVCFTIIAYSKKVVYVLFVFCNYLLVD